MLVNHLGSVRVFRVQSAQFHIGYPHDVHPGPHPRLGALSVRRQRYQRKRGGNTRKSRGGAYKDGVLEDKSFVTFGALLVVGGFLFGTDITTWYAHRRSTYIGRAEEINRRPVAYLTSWPRLKTPNEEPCKHISVSLSDLLGKTAHYTTDAHRDKVSPSLARPRANLP
jgi:hypothetical protein